MNILVCTLGASWAVIPEVFGFLAPNRLDLYAQHPRRAELIAERVRQSFVEPEEIWICTTEGDQTRKSIEQLRAWWRLLGEPFPLRIWTAAGTDQLASQDECDHLRELTLRIVLLASERTRGGQLVLSLAGGRKTMSADMQSAGSLFGAHAWLHVVGPDPLPRALVQEATPATFATALPPAIAGAVMPLVVGRGVRNELLDVDIAGVRVVADRFPIPLADPECSWPLPENGCALTHEIDERNRQGSRLLGNFLSRLASDEQYENWRSLYRLPPARIDTLRSTRIDAIHHEWLRALPKADLHRHLGGVLDLRQQRRVGKAVFDALAPAERAAALDRVAPLLRDRSEWAWDWPEAIKGDCRAANCAALLVEGNDAQLQRNLYDVTEPRIGLKTTSPRGFAAYERPGELTGSAILTDRSAIEPYAQALVEQACIEGLSYVELRGSPHKYRRNDGAAFLTDLRAAINRACAGVAEPPVFGFIWILDRRQRPDMQAIIAAAVAAHEHLGEFLIGLDLAGDEGTHGPEELASYFVAAFRACLRITIHAGEGESAENIWAAAYHLHADRVGHGLTLLDNPRLCERFRDRGVCIEICPTSNREVVGFNDPNVPASASQPAYPLRELMNAGLPIAICTDNPGISRTTVADEFLAAARMMPGGLTQWEALALVRQGFANSFAPAAVRGRLMKEADRRVFELESGMASLRSGIPP